MEIIPVIDLLGGRAVHAVGGRRHEYRPVVSRLTASAGPADLAAAMTDRCGWPFIYVADLDAILGTGSNADAVERIAERISGFVYCDAGLRAAADLDRLPARWNVVPVWASETALGPTELAYRWPAVFSVDLRGGRLLGDWAAWYGEGVTDDEAIAEMAVAGQRRTRAGMVILLDLHSVGRGGGPDALRHVPAVRAALPPGVGLAVGGGVRNRDDLARLADAGAEAALVATALHAGDLP